MVVSSTGLSKRAVSSSSFVSASPRRVAVNLGLSLNRVSLPNRVGTLCPVIMFRFILASFRVIAGKQKTHGRLGNRGFRNLVLGLEDFLPVAAARLNASP